MFESSSDAKPLAYDAYQKLADSYAASADTKPHNAYYERPAMLGLLPDVAGHLILDVGCGPGIYAEELVKRGARVDSIDASDRMLEHAAKRNAAAVEAGKVRFHQLDITQPITLFDDAAFDGILAPLCLDYVKDWTTLFRQFNRLLKPDGWLQYSAGHPHFDAEYFKTENYFSVERADAQWSGFGSKICMPGYRRSLSEAINPIMQAGLVLDLVHEPLPTEEFRKADLKRYDRLMHRPGFICIKARKGS